jgi:hypothetical protein
MQFAEQEKSKRDLTPLCTYMISASVPKIVLRMNQSTSFIEGLKDLPPFEYGQNEPPTKAPGTTIPDRDFCQVIPKLKAILGVDVPRLEALARDSQTPSFSYYTSETYMEFHSVLVAAISSFHDALIQLKAFKLNPKLEASLDEFEGCIADVAICGAILHSIAYGSAIERHLQAIAHLLPMHHQKHAISHKKVEVGKKEEDKEDEDEEDEEEEEDTDLLSVQPYTLVGLRRLPAWESYRNWLRLIISHFEALYVVSRHVSTHSGTPFTVDVLAVPAQADKVLKWRVLLAKKYTASAEGDPSVEDLIKTVESLKFTKPANCCHSKKTWFEKTFGDNAPLSKGHGFPGTYHGELCLSSLIWIYEHRADANTPHREFAPVSHIVFFPCHVVLKTYRFH